MRTLSGGVAHVANTIENDLMSRDISLHKPHIEGLADLSACALSCRNANTSEWKAMLPRKSDDKSKERYISRFLSNKLILPIEVMKGFIPEIIEMLCANDQTIILMLDQSKISDGFECLMVSLRVGERAMPVAWKVIETKGAIGFDVQEPLLNSVYEMIPKFAKILLAGDRFYGTSSIIDWCKKQNWQYRIRLKSNLNLDYNGGEIKTGEAASDGLTSLEDVYLHDVKTHIGILHDPGHKEPWIIAMDCVPSRYKVLDYGMRWGIECMFSDFKSRGFSITKTQLKHTDRIERLILILTIALIWAVSTGMRPQQIKRISKKKLIDP
jgi:Transposase DDE domain